MFCSGVGAWFHSLVHLLLLTDCNVDSLPSDHCCYNWSSSCLMFYQWETLNVWRSITRRFLYLKLYIIYSSSLFLLPSPSVETHTLTSICLPWHVKIIDSLSLPFCEFEIQTPSSRSYDKLFYQLSHLSRPYMCFVITQSKMNFLTESGMGFISKSMRFSIDKVSILWCWLYFSARFSG